MSRKQLKKAVIRYLEEKNYKFLRDLGKGGFADVIAVLTPDNQEEAIKIVQKRKIWPIEDRHWASLHHPNLVQLKNVMEIEELDVKLYFMPILPKALDDMLYSKEFRKDTNCFNRVKKWLLQILSAIEYLHDIGLCHLDIKSDNVLIDSDDNALLGDFSGLNFTKDPINRPLSPFIFRSPETFTLTLEGVQGQLYDVWTYGILALNVLTGHYYLRKTNQFTGKDVPLWSDLWPLLKKALEERKFQKLLTKAFPKVNLSSNDIHLTHHFVEFIMKIRPEARPNASRAKNHLFLKVISNPFTKDCYDELKRMSQGLNPFKKNLDELDPNSQGDTYIDPNSQGDTYISRKGAVDSSVEPTKVKGVPKRREIGKNVKNWFVKNINRVFRYKGNT